MPVEIFSKNLRLKMLSAKDERVVNAALRGVTEAEQALEFVQSFGLSDTSCAQLISVLNRMTLEKVGRNSIVSARPFVRAYAFKRIPGSEEVGRRYILPPYFLHPTLSPYTFYRDPRILIIS